MNVAGFSTVGKNEMWFGVTTTAGAATITITWSAANTLNTEIAVEEFSASDTGASWSVSTSNNFRSSNPGTTNCVFPSLVAAASGSLLGFGYASTGTAFTGIGTGASGDTYTYTVTGFSNGAVYAVNLTNGTTESPVGKQTSINQEILMHALMLYTPAAGGGAPKRALLGVGT